MMSPRCPYCNAQGISHLQAKNMAGYLLIYCGQCGAIHGVVPVPEKRTVQQPKELQRDTPEPKGKDPVTPDQARAMLRHHTHRGSTIYRRIIDEEEDQ